MQRGIGTTKTLAKLANHIAGADKPPRQLVALARVCNLACPPRS